MNRVAISMFLFALINFSAIAEQGHRHYVGQDSKTKKPCELMVEHEYFIDDVTTKENYRALVETSYTSFEDDQHFDEVGNEDRGIIVQFSMKNTKGLTGFTPDRSTEIAIILNNEASIIDDPKSFNIKRKHGNHYHVDSCLSLRLADHE